MKQVTQLFWKVSLNNIPMSTVSENVIALIVLIVLIGIVFGI